MERALKALRFGCFPLFDLMRQGIVFACQARIAIA
jgi:hypothetical protein